MADPFGALRLPDTPIDPDPTFATRLRSRLERALALPEGVTVSDLTLEAAPAPAPGLAAPANPGGIVPYLIVGDARRALDWYESALGATRRGDVLTMTDGRVGHAEFELSGSVVYLADESPESHVAAPRPGAAATVSLTVEVPDVDRSVDLALSEGAVLERAAADNPYGRNAVIRDPFGHRWILSAAPAPAVGGRGATGHVRQGDIGYVSLWVPELERAATFFAAVLGWSYEPAAEGHARQVVGRELHHGIFGGQERSTLFLCYVVDDIEAAVSRVRGAGGRADEPTMEPFGLAAMCVDVEGTQFSLYQSPPGPRGPRLADNGTRHGDVSYITMEVRDSAAVRAFYGSVLGWRFLPGRVEDGWGVEDVVPMTGLHGGHDVTTVLPMYRVDDIHDTVARVRAAGGSATDPERQPYGLSSECVDDQGTRFYLGQH
ncbi:MAG TPA: VOC family protein [Acidimicrobiales bacterium]|nr:VOC family protein [Acidimicrobiales bacterium]